MGLTADRLKKLKLVDEMCLSPWAARTAIRRPRRHHQDRADSKHLDELETLPPDKLRAQRNARIDSFGVFSEVAS